MRLFELHNLQDFALYLFPALAFVVLFGIGLAFIHFVGRDSEDRKTRIIERFSDGIEGRNAPFPLVLTLIIAGTVLWGILYTLFYGLLGVKI